MKQYIVIFLMCLTYNCYSQTINFTDLELKQYLINQPCVDTTNTGSSFMFSNDIDVDLNNDNEIQVSEAEMVLRLELTGNDYPFKSVEDLSQFPNLNYLNMVSCDSIAEFSNLISDSINSLIIGQCRTLKIIDISGLTGLSEVLRVEDMDQTLDYVNTQNGITPQLFSFFYTDHIAYACIDDNSTEYDEIEWKLTSGFPINTNCEMLSSNIQNRTNGTFELFPNPTSGIFEVKNFQNFDKLKIYNINGQLIEGFSINENNIDISNLKNGVYFIAFEFSGEVFYERIIKF